MSESESPPRSEDNESGRKRIRPRIRERVRERSSRSGKFKKWWSRQGNAVLIWGAFLVAAVVLIVAAQKGYLRGPSVPQPE